MGRKVVGVTSGTVEGAEELGSVVQIHLSGGIRIVAARDESGEHSGTLLYADAQGWWHEVTDI